MDTVLTNQIITWTREESWKVTLEKIISQSFNDAETPQSYFDVTIHGVKIEPVLGSSFHGGSFLVGLKLHVTDENYRNVYRRINLGRLQIDGVTLHNKVNELAEIGKKAKPIREEKSNRVFQNIEYMTQLRDDLELYTKYPYISLERGIDYQHFVFTVKFQIESEEDVRRIHKEIIKLHDSVSKSLQE